MIRHTFFRKHFVEDFVGDNFFNELLKSLSIPESDWGNYENITLSIKYD